MSFTDVRLAIGACLVFGAVVQFVLLPVTLYFQRGVRYPVRSHIDERIFASNQSPTVRSAGGNDTRVPTRNEHSTLSSFVQLAECPESDIPNLNKKNVLDLDECAMDKTESQIFGTGAVERVRQATTKAQSFITNFVDRKDWFKTSGRRRIEANLSQLKIDIGNYTFIPGGHWRPKRCIPRWKVAIIIPFRDRSYHLPIILRYLVPMLQRQQLEFGIFTVNQENDLGFNRAMLMNVGFLESMNLSHWDCFVFHDVDHVPMSDLNYYGCTHMPKHFLTGDSIWNYTLLYAGLFGGVTGLLESNMWKINGFPNVYWGWGGEDDEIRLRVQKAKLTVAEKPKGPNRYIGFYKVIQHHHNSERKLPERFKLLKNFKERMDHDGLNNLRYPPPLVEIHPLYVNISVNIFKLKLQ